MSNAIEIQAVSKTFDGITQVLSDINLNIPKHEVFGLLGPNGSGKTTLMRILNGILQATSGESRLFNQIVSPQDRSLRHLCGVMTENAQLYADLTTRQNLKFFAQMYPFSNDTFTLRLQDLSQKLELEAFLDTKVKNFSTGMRKRACLAIALIHDPQLLFLDEPTSGLDPESSLNVLKLLKALVKDEGKSIFLCTHQLSYAEEICSSYGFLSHGRLLAAGTYDSLLTALERPHYLHIRGNSLPLLAGAKQISANIIAYPITNDYQANDVVQSIIQVGGSIYEATQEKLSLEDLYFAYVNPQQEWGL